MLRCETRETAERLSPRPWRPASKDLRVAVRARARVPIATIEHLPSAVSADLMFQWSESSGGDIERTQSYLRRLVILFPSFRPLALFLKALLWCWKLDEPFTGGLGSYKLYTMLGYSLKHSSKCHQCHGSLRAIPEVGKALLDFLNLFSQRKTWLSLNAESKRLLVLRSQEVNRSCKCREVRLDENFVSDNEITEIMDLSGVRKWVAISDLFRSTRTRLLAALGCGSSIPTFVRFQYKYYSASIVAQIIPWIKIEEWRSKCVYLDS